MDEHLSFSKKSGAHARRGGDIQYRGPLGRKGGANRAIEEVHQVKLSSRSDLNSVFVQVDDTLRRPIYAPKNRQTERACACMYACK